MADLLTHVLVPYVLLTVASWRWKISRRWIPVAMAGATIPDLTKLDLLLDGTRMGYLPEIPFALTPISSVTGVALIATGITVWFERTVWPRVYALLVFGGVSSVVLDGLRAFADGASTFWLYPVWIRPPTPSLYVSSDPRVTMVTVAVATAVTIVQRRVVAVSAD